MGVGDNLLSSLKGALGVIEKAQIEILDFRDRVVNNKLPPTQLTGGNDVKLSGPGNEDVTAFADVGMTNDYMMETSGIDYGTGPGKQPPGVEQKTSLESVTRKIYTVQFNPSSLQLSAHGGGRVQKTKFNTVTDNDGKPVIDPDTGKPKVVAGGVSYGPASTTISLSVSLLFDAVDIQGAFMADKFNISPSALIGDLGKAINYNTNRKDEDGKKTDESNKKTSVQPEVEGFIGALRNRYTRLISFHWGNMAYTGVLRSVNATYTMFDPLGQPVRARVDMTIMCADADIYPTSLQSWRDRYRKIYDTTEGGISYVKGAQKVGNLLNI